MSGEAPEVPTASALHPHEPEIPSTLDADGRCLICGLFVEHDRLSKEIAQLREALRELVEASKNYDEEARSQLQRGGTTTGLLMWDLLQRARANALSLPLREGPR